MPGDQSCHNVEILDIAGDLVLAKHSDPTSPPSLVTALLTSPLTNLVFTHIRPVAPCPVPGLTWTPFTFQQSNIFTAHYVGPKSGSGVPLIVWPHGGPHSVITTSFMSVVMFWTSLGYGILFVNYRGSLGFSEDNVRCLLGKVGDQDVKDCHQVNIGLSLVNS